MQYSYAVVLLITFLSLAYAAPATENRAKVSSFKVHQKPRKVPLEYSRKRKLGPSQYLKALKKYNASPAYINVVGVAASGAVTATPPSGGYDVEYDCPVTIGNQVFNLNFDTGSSDLWVFGTGLKSTVKHTYYNPTKTATVIPGQSWNVTYGDGSNAYGTVYLDQVKVGNTLISKQAVEVAKNASASFINSRSCDGLLGLGFDNINQVKPVRQNTFITNAIMQGLPQKVFTSKLKKGGAGSYSFGAIDPKDYTGQITYTNVDSSQGWWMFTPSAYAIGTAAAVPSTKLRGIADTGTTLLLLDPTVVTAYYAKVLGAQNSQKFGGWVFPCVSILPNFTITIGTYKAVIPGNYMNYGAVGNMCYGGLQSNAGIGLNLYGDIFLKSQFVVWDRGTLGYPRLGFAAQKW